MVGSEGEVGSSLLSRRAEPRSSLAIGCVPGLLPLFMLRRVGGSVKEIVKTGAALKAKRTKAEEEEMGEGR